MAENEQQKGGRGWIKLVVLLLVVAAIGAGFYWLRDTLTLEQLSQHEQTLVKYREQYLLLFCLAAFLLYVLVTGLSLPGATVMTLAYGWFFGFWHSVLMISLASTLGATLALLLSRYLFREAVQSRFGDRLRTFIEALERDGAFYLFTLRLIPPVPFFVINLVMGLTTIRVWTFWWVSQLGMLPATCVYVYAGAQVPSIQELSERGASGILDTKLVVAFVLLGLFPLAVKKLLEWFGKRPTVG